MSLLCPREGDVFAVESGAKGAVGVALVQGSRALVIRHAIGLRAILRGVGARAGASPIATLQQTLGFTKNDKRVVTMSGLPQVCFSMRVNEGRRISIVGTCRKLVLLGIEKLTKFSRTIHLHSGLTKLPRAVVAFIKSDKQDMGVLIPFLQPSNSLPTAMRRTELFRTRTCR